MLETLRAQQAAIQLAFDSAMQELDTDDQLDPPPEMVFTPMKRRLEVLGLQLALAPIDDEHPVSPLYLDDDRPPEE